MMTSAFSLRPYLIAASLALATSTASAQFAPRVTSDEIDGAIMPAVPFSTKDRMSKSDEAPTSLGLVPETIIIDSEVQPQPAKAPRPVSRGLSAQETADRLLAR